MRRFDSVNAEDGTVVVPTPGHRKEGNQEVGMAHWAGLRLLSPNSLIPMHNSSFVKGGADHTKAFVFNFFSHSLPNGIT
jgi:hypothetical protein